MDAVVDQIDRAGLGDVTLVGHSWGGYVIAGAAPRIASRLARMVFWSAFVPEAGVPLNDELPPDYRAMFAQLAGASADNTLALPVEVFQAAFLNDAAPDVAAVVHSVLRPQPFATFTDAPVGGAAYRDLGVPMDYVLSAGDTALPPGEFGWSRFHARLKTEPVMVPVSHESQFTFPGELADALIKVAAALSRTSTSARWRPGGRNSSDGGCRRGAAAPRVPLGRQQPA